MILANQIRRILWRVLGVDYSHILRVVDYVFLHEDEYTTIGYKSYSNNALVFRWSNTPIIIGKYCAIANGVRFVVDNDKHLLNSISSYPFRCNPCSNKVGISIGNDVWIGQNAIILPGVKIGDGATIAAGAVVNDDVLPYTIVGGVPAKVLKEKCTREEAVMMSEIAWWDWDDRTIESRCADFKLAFTEFISKYGKH